MQKSWILGVVFGCQLQAAAAPIDITTFRHVGPFPMQTPLLIDSTGVDGKSFDTKSLLTGNSLPLAALKEGQILADGRTEACTQHALHLAGFSVQVAHYAKTKITVSGPQHRQLFVDGRPAQEGTLSLEPGRHAFAIRYLLAPDSACTLKASFDGGDLQQADDGPDALRPYSLKDVMNGTRIAGAELSADGKYLLTRYTTTRDGGATESRCRITELGSGRQVADTRERLAWMPRSTRYYFTRNGLQGRELVTVDATDGNEQVLTRTLPEGSFRFAPSEDYLIFTHTAEGPKEDRDIYEVLEPDDRQPGWRNRPYYSKYDLRTGVTQLLTFGHHNVWISDVSDDGRTMLLMVTEPRITRRPFYPVTLLRLNVETLRTDTLLRQEGFVNSARFCKDEGQLLITASPEAFGGVGLAVKDGQTASMYETELFRFDIATRKAVPLTRDFHPSVSQVGQRTADGRFYFTAENRDRIDLYVLNPASGRIDRIDTREEVVRGFSNGVTGQALVYYGESASNADRLYSVSPKNGKTTLLEDLSARKLAGIRLGECRSWDFVNQRGDTICGRFYLPADFDATKKYPLIVNYYGGCSPTSRYLESRYPHHVYAAQGYIVYVIQPSGATGFGQEFAARHVNAWGDFTADDIIEGTQRFCQEHPFVNEKKIGCIGASYGGFMTQYLQTKTDLFAAAISHAGISNVTSYWGEGYWGYSYSEIAAANSYPWNRPELYTQHSPLFNAEKIHTPLLFLHGSVDTNVPIGESIQMFTALKLLGRETAFVTVEGQNHQILDYGKRIKWQNTIFAWFAKWLQDDDTWWNALYPPKQL